MHSGDWDSSDRHGRLYAFDLDDNIITTNCCVLTEEGRRVSTRDYVKLRQEIKLDKDAFREFQDIYKCTAARAICYDVFAEALRKHHPIAVVTARSNAPDSIRSLIARVSDTEDVRALRRLYIYCCGDISNPLFRNAPTAEDRKVEAIRDFVRSHPTAASIGFSDDDLCNIRQVVPLFERLSTQGLNCYLYDSSSGHTARKYAVGK